VEYKNRHKELHGSVYDLFPQDKAQNATFCSYLFEWYLQYNIPLFIGEFDNTNRLQLQLNNSLQLWLCNRL
jgi:hypothetical protein